MTTQSHHDHVEKQFSSQASEYLTSTVHASGQDLQRLAVRLADYPDASVLDMGCGAGHASFVAAQNVSTVVAYDLSAHMLDVVAQAAEARQLSSQASEYLTSTVHASGQDLQRLAVRLADYPDASVLDMGCGAGHASFVAAQNVSTVVAYDLSAHMLDVVAQAAEARQLKNITTRQGYVESLPFADICWMSWHKLPKPGN